MGQAYHSIFDHLNWHCRGDRPLIRPAWEAELHQCLDEKARSMRGVWCRGVGGTEDHVHLVVQTEPSVTPSKLIGELKGASSHWANKRCGGGFAWQRGYGIVTFSARQLRWIQDYVARQKEHHTSPHTLNDMLEHWEPDAEDEDEAPRLEGEDRSEA